MLKTTCATEIQQRRLWTLCPAPKLLRSLPEPSQQLTDSNSEDKQPQWYAENEPLDGRARNVVRRKK